MRSLGKAPAQFLVLGNRCFQVIQHERAPPVPAATYILTMFVTALILVALPRRTRGA